jgi:DNA gyrase subunit B
MATTGTYDAESIQVLTGLEPVRKRPGMYVGDVESGFGMHVLLWEVVGNAIDEFLAGHARHVRIAFDGSRVTIEDDGRGIPVEALELVLTTLHAGTAGWRHAHVHLNAGLRGIGVAVTNALARELEATVWRDGSEHVIRFACGKPLGDLETRGPTSRTGTRISFVPDFTILAEHAWEVDAIASRCRTLAGMLPGLTITVGDDTYRYDSLAEYVEQLAECDVIDPFVLRTQHGGIVIDLAIAWTRGVDTHLDALVNCSPCAGGMHVDALFGALHAVLAPLLPRTTMPAFRKRISRGMVGVLHVQLRDPRFGNPRKDWLQNQEVHDVVRAIAAHAFEHYVIETPALLDALLLDLAPRRKPRVRVRHAHGGGP